MGSPPGGSSAAALAAESGGISGTIGTWAKAIEPHASASDANPKINFVIVFIMFFPVVRTNLSLAVTLRKEGQVELQGEKRPNNLTRRDTPKLAGTLSTQSFAGKTLFLLSTRQRNTS